MVKTISSITRTVFDSKVLSIVQANVYNAYKILSSNKNVDEWNEHLNVTINIVHVLKYHTLLMKVRS